MADWYSQKKRSSPDRWYREDPVVYTGAGRDISGLTRREERLVAARKQALDDFLSSDAPGLKQLKRQRLSGIALRALIDHPDDIDQGEAISALTRSDRLRLAGYKSMVESRPTSPAEIPYAFAGRGGVPVSPITRNGPLAGVIKGATFLDVPGYDLYAERHPFESGVSEMAGALVPFTGGTKALGAAGLAERAGKGLGVYLTNTAVRAGRDALLMGGLDATSALMSGKWDQIGPRFRHSAGFGLGFGLTGGMTAPLRGYLSPVRVGAQGFAGWNVTKLLDSNATDEDAAIGAMTAALFEGVPAALEMGNRVAMARWAKREAPKLAAQPTKETIVLTQDATGYKRTVELTDKQRPHFINRVKAIGIDPSDAEQVAAGRMSVDQVVRNSIPDDVSGPEWFELYRARMNQVRGNLTVTTGPREDAISEVQLAQFNAGADLTKIISMTDLNPALKNAWTKFTNDFSLAVARGDALGAIDAVEVMNPPSAIKRIAKGGWKVFVRSFGKQREVLHQELPPEMADEVYRIYREGLTQIAVTQSWLEQHKIKLAGKLLNAKPADQEALYRVDRGIRRIHSDGSFEFATRAADGDVVEVRRMQVPGFGESDVVDLLPNGPGGEKVTYLLANRAGRPDYEITDAPVNRAIPEGATHFGGFPVLRAGDAGLHGGRTLYVGDRGLRDPEIRPTRSRITLAELEVPKEEYINARGQKRTRNVRKARRLTRLARFDYKLNDEAFAFERSPEPQQFDISQAKRGDVYRHEGNAYIFDSVLPGSNAEAPTARLVRQADGQILDVPVENNVITLAPERGVQSEPVRASDLPLGQTVYVNGRPFRVARTEKVGPSLFNSANETHRMAVSDDAVRGPQAAREAFETGLRPRAVQDAMKRQNFVANLEDSYPEWREVVKKEGDGSLFHPGLRFYSEVDPQQTLADYRALAKEYPNLSDYLKAVKGVEETAWTGLLGADIPPDSRELRKQIYRIQSGLIPEAAYAPDVPVDVAARWLGRGFRTGYSIRDRSAGTRKLKTGRLAASGQNLRNTPLADLVNQEQIATESILRTTDARLLAVVGQPLPKGTPVPEGWTTLNEVYRYHPERLESIARDYSELLDHWNETGIEGGPRPDLRTAIEDVSQRVVVPNVVLPMLGHHPAPAADFMASTSPEANAVGRGLKDTIKTIIGFYNANLLTRPSTAMRNFITGELLYLSQTVEDGWNAALDASLMRAFPGYERDPLVLRQAVNDIKAYTASIHHDAVANIPAEILTGSYVNHIIRDSMWRYQDPVAAANSVLGKYGSLLDVALIPFSAGEAIPKRRVAWSRFRSEAEERAKGMTFASRREKLAWIREQTWQPGGKAIASAQDAISRTVNYDYSDPSRAFDWLTKLFGRGVMPFGKYFYFNTRKILVEPIESAINASRSGVKLTRAEIAQFREKKVQKLAKEMAMRATDPRVAKAYERVQQLRDPKLLDVDRAKTAKDLRANLARVLTSVTMWTLASEFANLFEWGRDAVAGRDLDWEYQTGGRARIHTSDDGQEYWVRLYDMPWLGDQYYLKTMMDGGSSILDFFRDRLSPGLVWNIMNAIMGFDDEYTAGRSAGWRFADIVASGIPLYPGVQAGRRILDPVVRTTEDTNTNDFEAFAFNLLNHIPGASAVLPPKTDKHTGEVLTYDAYSELMKLFILNVRKMSREGRIQEEEEKYRAALRSVNDRIYRTPGLFQPSLHRQQRRLAEDRKRLDRQREDK